MSDRILSIVFVHGFRGDHTSFQSFPADLHCHLSMVIPGLQTFVYPTYKTKRPLELARDDFLTCSRMEGLPKGGVILCGHSMGGLLTAEVALAAPPSRVVGLVSFDTPYLGVHPRVVLSGITSLFKKKEELTGHRTSSTSTPCESPNERPGEAPPATHPEPPPQPDVPTSSPPATRESTVPPSLHLSVPIPPVRVIAPRVERLFQTFRLGPVPQSVHNFLHFWDKHPGVTGLKDGMFKSLSLEGACSTHRGPYGRGWVNLWTTPVSSTTRERSPSGPSSSPSPSFRSRLSPFSSPTPSLSSFNSGSFQSSLFQTISYDPSMSSTVTSLDSIHSRTDPGPLATTSSNELQTYAQSEFSKGNENKDTTEENSMGTESREAHREEKQARKRDELELNKQRRSERHF
ncbi:alpha/beta hydrolase family protein [Rhizoctonia solani]|uniref:Alpha/beta hydrolase family protein n=1 Tax=Rhizoctonia solani TaxID=456999 RepID=A0A8H8NXX5_9AGAM|nr:alpha/beta hydrolase family protein [Rhizoctonia solani]QRW20928.1 alpha/beta hydrolase family protein [Rhizoctonia solani]